MRQRKIELFTADCPVCDELVAAVQEAACSSCAVEVRSLKKPDHAAAAERYGIRCVPAVIIDGSLAECCTGAGPDLRRLQALGLGQPAP